MRQIVYFVVLAACLSSHLASASDCGGCKINNARLPNIVFANATGSSDVLVASNWTVEEVNASYCGCPDLVNSVFGYGTDLQGRPTDIKMATYRINLSYNASLKVTKTPLLVRDMDEVGLNLALLVYRITVENTGNVTISDIELNDTPLGMYHVDDLAPGENATVMPMPYYIITVDDVKHCNVINTVSVTGKDRCCKLVGPVNKTADFYIGADELERVLKIYSKELFKVGENVSEHPSVNSLADFEGKIRVQSNRLLTFGNILHGNFTQCDPIETSLPSMIGARDERDGSNCRICRL